MDKENNELLKEEESLNGSILNSDRKIINVINSDNFKERLKEFMNKNQQRKIKIFYINSFFTI